MHSSGKSKKINDSISDMKVSPKFIEEISIIDFQWTDIKGVIWRVLRK